MSSSHALTARRTRLRLAGRSRARAGLVLVSALALTATACSAQDATAQSSAASAGASQAAGAAGASDSVARAQAFIKPYLSTPAKLNISTPLTEKPAPGKTFVYLQCEQPQCQVVGVGVKKAAAAVGWKVKTIPFVSSNPATLVSGFNQALQEKPAAVGVIAEPFALWQQVVPKYKAAKVPIIASFVGPATVDDTVIANIADPDYSHLQGKLLADWFIADSGGKGHALSAAVPDFPYLGQVSVGFEDEVAKECPACKVTKLAVGVPDIGSGAINGKIVSALRKDPSITYDVNSDIVFVQALPPALAAAGLGGGKVKIAGCCGATATEQGLRDGTFHAISASSSFIAGWQVIDAALRHDQGLPVPKEEGSLLTGLLLKDTTVPAADSFDYPADYEDQFKALWKLS